VLRRQRPGRGGWPITPRDSRTPIRSSSRSRPGGQAPVPGPLGLHLPAAETEAVLRAAAVGDARARDRKRRGAPGSGSSSAQPDRGPLVLRLVPAPRPRLGQLRGRDAAGRHTYHHPRQRRGARQAEVPAQAGLRMPAVISVAAGTAGSRCLLPRGNGGISASEPDVRITAGYPSRSWPHRRPGWPHRGRGCLGRRPCGGVPGLLGARAGQPGLNAGVSRRPRACGQGRRCQEGPGSWGSCQALAAPPRRGTGGARRPARDAHNPGGGRLAGPGQDLPPAFRGRPDDAYVARSDGHIDSMVGGRRRPDPR
jgi:hypothetical protein